MTDAIDWNELSAKLPTEKTDEQKEKRKALWSSIDENGSGFASLAEIDKGVRDVLGLDDVFDAKPAIMRAFQSAKNYGKESEDSKGAEYIEFKEFRVFLVALRQRFEYWHAFKRIDVGDDGRIDVDEFTAAAETIEKWVGKLEDPVAEFAAMDKNGGGQVLFDEFCEWSIQKDLDLEE